MRTDTFTCSRCGVTEPAWNIIDGMGGTSRYTVRSSNGAKLCKACGDAESQAEIQSPATVRAFGYLKSGMGGVSHGDEWQSVSGGKLGTVVHVGAEVPRTRYGPYGVRHFVRVRDVFGSLWHGTAARGMYVTLRRVRKIPNPV